MGDMGDLFRDLRDHRKEQKAKRLDEALPTIDLTVWTRHTQYHYSRIISGQQLNWYPSTGKWQFGKTRGGKPKMFYGTRADLEGFIKNQTREVTQG